MITGVMYPPTGRRETKYLLSYAEYLLARSRVASFFSLDEHAGEEGYFIRSIYFDDISDRAYREKANGIPDRKKYRIRLYNDDTGYILLECKEKENKYIRKRSARVNEELALSLIEGDYDALGGREEPLLKEFLFIARETGLRSLVTVDYWREAFVYPASNLRITFDKGLRAAGLTDIALQKGSGEELSLPVFPSDSVIMEIKFDDFMPEIVRTLISHETGKPRPLSKYCLCRNVKKGIYQ